MIRSVYMVKKGGDPLYGRSFEEGACIDLAALPSYVRNSVVMMQSSSSTTSDRVYTLELEDCVWSYSFFPSFALVSMASRDQSLTQLKNLMQSLGRAIAHEYQDLIESWSGSMSDIADINALIDNYLSVSLDLPRSSNSLNGSLTKRSRNLNLLLLVSLTQRVIYSKVTSLKSICSGYKLRSLKGASLL